MSVNILCLFVYVNHTGAQTEIILMVVQSHLTPQGNTTYELELFPEDFQVIDVDPASGNATALTPSNPSQKYLFQN